MTLDAKLAARLEAQARLLAVLYALEFRKLDDRGVALARELIASPFSPQHEPEVDPAGQERRERRAEITRVIDAILDEAVDLAPREPE